MCEMYSRMGSFVGGNEHVGYVKSRQFLEEMVSCYNLKQFAPRFLNRSF